MTVPWSSILATYESFDDELAGGVLCRHLKALAENIAQSPFSDRIFGWTSHASLCVVPHPVSYPYDAPLLHVSQPTNEEVTFRYQDTLVSADQWTRTVAGDAAFECLSKFLANVGWVPEQVLP